MNRIVVLIITLILIQSCNTSNRQEVSIKDETPFFWDAASVYFLLTDRFNNADPTNDLNFGRTDKTAVLRGFEGGDIRGVIEKVNDGYFTDLGINALWMTPLVEQIKGSTDEGTGVTYGFHGYWTRDWTALDPNFGTMKDLEELIEVAHARGIRVLLDAVINHTGPVTPIDSVWPNAWVRTDPACTYKDYETAVTCTLVENLPDIKTESNETVELPDYLVEKWKTEGRYEQEVSELNEFFERTGYPRAPRFYIIKWLTDYIKDFGIDGFRADTVRHIEESVWAEFYKECQYSFELWKQNNPEKVLDNNDFYTVGEVYGYEIIKNGTEFDFGDVKVDYYKHGFTSMINFEFRNNAHDNYETLFSYYSNALNGELKGKGVLNYVSSHDDSYPYDKERGRPLEAGTKLLLSPGTAQVYYGDEVARELIVEGANGDANLRSVMDWTHYNINEDHMIILEHWQLLGVFRKNHPSVGAGEHKMISESPYVFQRTYENNEYTDRVVVGLDLPLGIKEISVGANFEDGDTLRDAYSGLFTKVKNGKVTIETNYDIVLLEKFSK